MAKMQWLETEPSGNGTDDLKPTLAYILSLAVTSEVQLKVLKQMLTKQGIAIDEVEYATTCIQEVRNELDRLASKATLLGELARGALRSLDATVD